MVEKEKGCNAANCDKHCSLCYLWVIPEGLVLYRGLRRGYTGDRYAEGRAADVVHAEFGAELDAGRFASVFATDTYLEVRTGCTTFLNAHSHELAYTGLIENFEGIDFPCSI